MQHYHSIRSLFLHALSIVHIKKQHCPKIDSSWCQMLFDHNLGLEKLPAVPITLSERWIKQSQLVDFARVLAQMIYKTMDLLSTIFTATVAQCTGEIHWSCGCTCRAAAYERQPRQHQQCALWPSSSLHVAVMQEQHGH